MSVNIEDIVFVLPAVNVSVLRHLVSFFDIMLSLNLNYIVYKYGYKMAIFTYYW